MNFKELFEGATPKLPGAVSGIKVMSMDQFLAQSNDEPDEEQIDEMSFEELDKMSPEQLVRYANDARNNKIKNVDPKSIDKAYGKSMSIMFPDSNKRSKQSTNHKQQGVTEGSTDDIETTRQFRNAITGLKAKSAIDKAKDGAGAKYYSDGRKVTPQETARRAAERKAQKDKKGMAEATKLPAQTRELKGQELDDYLDRIRNREKGKTDKYKLPYIHRSSVVKYYNEEGKRYDTDQIKQTLGIRPKKLLKQNEKMKHSNGELEQFFNIGFAALVGIALDENTNELIVVNTCPGAGSCKIECFAMKGGKVQFEGPWLSDGRILTFLLNDPDGFFNQLSNDITKEEKLAQKGGYNLTIRWHDAGDFFSPEYMDLAFKLAAAHPDVKFYAYTKIADAALGQKPNNFIVNWSEGASTSQEKKVKAQDANLDKTKNSRIVPSKLFYDLLKKDKEGKLDKTADGAWQPKDAAALNELKDRLAAAYNLKRDSIISYSEMMATPQKNNVQKWNVIIAPGEGDISANRLDVLSTLLLKH
jgi:hypothetical protein